MSKPHLILDLDETLVRGEKAPLERSPDFVIRGKYFMYKRPFLSSFLHDVQAHYAVSFWSSSTERYVGEVLAGILPTGYRYGWSWCDIACDWQAAESHPKGGYHVKDLAGLTTMDIDLSRTLVVDNTPRKLERQAENHVPIASYYAAKDDEELPRLARFLSHIADQPDFRLVNKSNW